MGSSIRSARGIFRISRNWHKHGEKARLVTSTVDPTVYETHGRLIIIVIIIKKRTSATTFYRGGGGESMWRRRRTRLDMDRRGPPMSHSHERTHRLVVRPTPTTPTTVYSNNIHNIIPGKKAHDISERRPLTRFRVYKQRKNLLPFSLQRRGRWRWWSSSFAVYEEQQHYILNNERNNILCVLYVYVCVCVCVCAACLHGSSSPLRRSSQKMVARKSRQTYYNNIEMTKDEAAEEVSSDI